MYLNDIAVGSSQMILYADDTTLCCDAESKLELNRKMTAGHKVVSEWFTDNRLHENVGKTAEIVFTNKRDKDKYKPVRYLGLILDDDLGWHAHGDALAHKINVSTYLI